MFPPQNPSRRVPRNIVNAKTHSVEYGGDIQDVSLYLHLRNARNCNSSSGFNGLIIYDNKPEQKERYVGAIHLYILTATMRFLIKISFLLIPLMILFRYGVFLWTQIMVHFDSSMDLYFPDMTFLDT